MKIMGNKGFFQFEIIISDSFEYHCYGSTAIKKNILTVRGSTLPYIPLYNAMFFLGIAEITLTPTAVAAADTVLSKWWYLLAVVHGALLCYCTLTLIQPNTSCV